jgi:hypothetical protein
VSPPPTRLLLAGALLLLSALTLSAQAAAPAPPQSAAPDPAAKAWTLGLARLGLAKAGDQSSALQDSLPRLVASYLRVLPSRHTPEAAALESSEREVLRSHFAAGDDLATKLDARALRFFEPVADPNARKDELAAADRQIQVSARKLADLDTGTGVTPAPLDREARLWDGHAKGLLIDTPSSSLLQAARAAGVDLLVTGSLGLQSGYAIIQLRGFDASLEREVFSWKSYCSVDDPGPAALEMADRLERWVAGRNFARIELSIKPPSAELRVDGRLFTGASPIFYAYSDGALRIEASASGRTTKFIDVDYALGDRKIIDIALEPRVTGEVILSAEPEGAAVSLDSVPIGRSPATIELDGSRGIATLSAAGREPQSLVLPPSGSSELKVELLPKDGLGPAGRILAAKDSFYQALGWFVISLPVSTLTAGLFRGYDEAYARSGDQGMLVSRNLSVAALSASVAAAGVAATFMVIRLIRYLGVAH